jgi:hypothetical protein
MRRALAAALLLAALPAPARAAPPRLTVVACAPGYPGTTAEAQPAMDALAVALARVAGWPAGSIGAVYLQDEREGLARLGQADAAVALVPLAFFLAHADGLHLAARLQVATQGAGPSERWSLVAKKGRAAGPGGLDGLAVTSIAGYAPAFVRGAAGGGGARLPDSTRVVPSGQVLSALRQAAAGADVAVLLDGEQAAALPSLPFAGDLEVVARSPAVPTALVATVGARLAPARWAELEQGFLKLAADPAGAAALEGIRMTGFASADPRLLAAARALVAGPAR